MSLWWLQPGWTDTTCASCGARIYPYGDPDWGLCVECFETQMKQEYPPEPECFMAAADMPPEEPA